MQFRLIARTCRLHAAQKAFQTCLASTLAYSTHRDQLDIQAVRGDCLCGLGSVLMDLGKLDEALSMLQEALKVTREAHGESSAIAVECLNNLATCHRRLGQWEEALNIYFECQRREGEDATILNNIAGIFQERGFFVEALSYYERCVALDQRRGPANADYAVSLNHVALMRMELGQYDEALNLLETACQILDGSLGCHHATTASVSKNLADCLLSLQKELDALKLYESCLETQRRALGARHPDVCDTLTRMSTCLLRLQRIPEAAEHTMQAAEHMLSFLTCIWPALPEAKQVALSQRYTDAALMLPALLLELRETSSRLPEQAVRLVMLRKCLQWEFQAYQARSASSSSFTAARREELLETRQQLARLVYPEPSTQVSRDDFDSLMKKARLCHGCVGFLHDQKSLQLSRPPNQRGK